MEKIPVSRSNQNYILLRIKFDAESESLSEQGLKICTLPYFKTVLCNIDITKILKFSQKEKTAHLGTIIYQFDNACYVAEKKLEVKIMNLE